MLAELNKTLDEREYTPEADPMLLGKKDFSEENRQKLAAEGKALPDGSFPIESALWRPSAQWRVDALVSGFGNGHLGATWNPGQPWRREFRWRKKNFKLHVWCACNEINIAGHNLNSGQSASR